MSEHKQESTRDNILRASLKLFSKKGYKGTTVREIASAVNLQQSALYNHFKNKEDILDTLIGSLMESALVGLFEGKDSKESYKKGKSVLRHIAGTFKLMCFDPKNEMLLRFMMQEIYKNQKIRIFYHEHFYQENVKKLSLILFMMMQDDMIKPYDPLFLANEFFSPLFFYQMRIIQLRIDEQSTSAAATLFEKHVDFFWESIKMDNSSF